MQLEQSRRELLRWQILQILNKCRQNFTKEQQIMLIIGDEIQDCSHSELRDELSYLESKELLEIDVRSTAEGKCWYAKIEAIGMDYVEHNSANIVGIARPAKYWR
jgi:hypothetical protein